MRLKPTTATHDYTAGFTLAELLAVIAIIGIMLVVGLPAFRNLTNTSKLDTAANRVHSALKMAHHYARTHNQPAYLVFHTAQTAADDSTLAYRSFAVFTIDVHTKTVSQAAGLFLSDWQRLPEGLIFDADAGDAINNIFVAGDGQQWSGGFDHDRRLYIEPDTYPALGFRPGGMQRMEIEHDIYLAEGFYDDSGSMVRTSGQGKRIRVDAAGNSRITSVSYTANGAPAD